MKSGDTLAAIFKRAGFSSKDVHQVAQLPHTKKLVKKIRPGDIFYLYQNQDKKFAGLDYQLSPIETLIITPEETGLSERIETKAVEIQTRLITATIRSNFWNAAIDAGVSPNQIMQLATIFGWDIDFALDIRKGDQFTMMFESHYSDGKFLKDGHILAAEFINQRDVFTAFRHSNGEYYSADGRSMRKAFLRSPVDFKYVSSNFNPRRLHPVTGQVKAHRGVDYVAAVGTPIKSAGAGRVIEASYNQYNGNYVFIKHNETYTTKYLHLNKRKVKKGQTVKQGEIIGTLGATGRVTGAHLHYEFIVNGVHRNPRTVQLPKADSIARSERQAFVNTAELQLARLHAFKESHSHLASDMILSK